MNKIYKNLCFVSMLAILGCEQAELPESQKFLDTLKTKTEAQDTPVSLKEITNFPWQSVCFLKVDDSSSPTMAYEYLVKQLKNSNTSVEKFHIPKSHYNVVAIFKNDQGVVRAYGFRNWGLKIGEITYSLKPLDSKKDSLGEICFESGNADVKKEQSKKYENQGYLYIYNREIINDSDLYSR